MQRSPAELQAAPTEGVKAWSRSASGITIIWFFAPPSAWTRLPVFVPVAGTYSAIAVEPKKLTAWMVLCWRIASTADLSPWDDVEDAVRKPCFFEHFSEQDR